MVLGLIPCGHLVYASHYFHQGLNANLISEKDAYLQYHIAFVSLEWFSFEILVLGIFILMFLVLADALKHGCCLWHREAFGKNGVKIFIAYTFMLTMDNMR